MEKSKLLKAAPIILGALTLVNILERNAFGAALGAAGLGFALGMDLQRTLDQIGILEIVDSNNQVVGYIRIDANGISFVPDRENSTAIKRGEVKNIYKALEDVLQPLGASVSFLPLEEAQQTLNA